MSSCAQIGGAGLNFGSTPLSRCSRGCLYFADRSIASSVGHQTHIPEGRERPQKSGSKRIRCRAGTPLGAKRAPVRVSHNAQRVSHPREPGDSAVSNVLDSELKTTLMPHRITNRDAPFSPTARLAMSSLIGNLASSERRRGEQPIEPKRTGGLVPPYPEKF
jgi:hypothetical protein